MKKILQLCLFVFIFTFFILVNSNLSYADSLIVSDSVVTEEVMDGGVNYKYETITVKGYNTANTYTGDFMSLTLNDAHNGNIKLVPWTSEGKYECSNVSLDKIAEDYEAKHPGWKIIGGLNSEGWWSEGGVNQISNTFVQDGNNMRTSTSSEQFKEMIGIYEDNNLYIKRFPEYTDCMKLNLYNEDNEIIEILDVNSLNVLPSGNDLSVITMQSPKLDVTGYHVVSGSYEVYRRPTFCIAGTYLVTDTENNVHLRGSIDGIFDGSSVAGTDYKFYFVSNNEEVINKIANADHIRCQYEFVDEFKNTPNITGYMFKIIENGQILTPDYYQDNSQWKNITRGDDSFYYNAHSYVTGNKQRSCIGITKDGGIILMSALNKTAQGPSLYSLGYVLKERGVVNAYQFDGGSSVTFVKRNEFGKFDRVSNTGASVATGLFFAIPDPMLKASYSTRDSISFFMGNPNVSNVAVYLNGVKHNLDSDNLTISGLEEETNYEYYFTYDIPSYLDSSKTISTRTMNYHIMTEKFDIPSPQIQVSNIGKYSITFERTNTKYEFKDVVLTVGGSNYNMGSNTSLLVDGLIDGTNYPITVSYSVLDPETSKYYSNTLELDSITTLEFEVPSISEFYIYKELKDGKITFKYKVTDEDDLVKEISVFCGSDVDSSTKLSGSISFEDITENCKAYLEIAYYDLEEKLHYINSEQIDIIVSENPGPTPGPTPGPNPVDEPAKKGKCGKKSALLITSIISLSTVLGFILKKRH